jgi:hypothetical protein
MQKALLKRIVKEGIRKQRKNIPLSQIAIRKRITLAVAREITQESPLAERYWNIFVEATEAEADLWMFLNLENVRRVVLDANQIRQLASLYERWQGMCEFMIDEYDVLPPRFKEQRWSKDVLIKIAGFVASTKEVISADFAERGRTELVPEHFTALKGMIDWVRFVTLGQDSYLEFIGKMYRAIQFVRQHPHFARRPEPKQ